MNIWLIQTGEPLPSDADRPRLLRTGLLADELARRGHEVTWWATTFRHATKTHRASRDTTVSLAPNYRLLLLHSPGYSSNVSLRRFVDHRIVGYRFRKWARAQPVPDVIQCAFPAIELAYETARYAQEHGVPWVIDARDMWPDIYVDAVPPIARGAVRRLLGLDFRMTRFAFQHADAISAHAPGFVRWGLNYAGRQQSQLDVDIPFGYPSLLPSDAECARAREQWRALGIGRDADEFNVCFLGTFAARPEVDLTTVVAAARLLEQRAVPVRFVLCGDGPSGARIRELARGLSNVVLPGLVDYPRIWTLLRMSRLGLLPYLPSADFALSIPNKVVEYLSAGLPVLTSLTGGHLDQVLQEAGCGRFYRGSDPQSLHDAVLQACNEPQQLRLQGQAATSLFGARFAASIVNEKLIEHLIAVRGSRERGR